MAPKVDPTSGVVSHCALLVIGVPVAGSDLPTVWAVAGSDGCAAATTCVGCGCTCRDVAIAFNVGTRGEAYRPSITLNFCTD